MAELLENQYEVSENIFKMRVNFRKDGPERKSSVDYFKRKLSYLEELWDVFQSNHDRIISEVSRTDNYFKQKCFENTRDIYSDLKLLINEGYQRVLAKEKEKQEAELRASPSSEEQEVELKQKEKAATGAAAGQLQGVSSREAERQLTEPAGSNSNRGTFSRMDEVLRKQQANFKAFGRTVKNINIDSIMEKWEFEDALKSLETRWSAIDHLHWEIDSELEGKDLAYECSFTKYEEQYYKLKKDINKKMWSVNHREKSTPILDIPIFHGNYNNWMSFKDLFIEAIHSNPSLPNAQKMQFLKGKIKGEAERLIQHLTISSKNYVTCWEILNHRYNNKKLIFSSHMNTLFNIPNIQQTSLTQIKRMHDVTVETMHAVKNLGVDTSTWDPILVHIITNKLDSETYTDYVESLKNSRELPSLQELLDFLENKFTTLETSSRRKQEIQTPSQKSNYNQTSKKSNNYNSNNEKHPGNTYMSKSCHVATFKCPLCKNEHGIYNCKTFLQMPNDKKLTTINKLGICQNCLFSHNGNDCNSTKTCRKCSMQHNTIIHDAIQSSSSQSTFTRRPANLASTSHVSQNDYSEILLATAQLKVRGINGTYYRMRALVDPGSQISIITEHAAQLLGIKRTKCHGVIYGVGKRENNCKGKINITCSSLHDNYTFEVDAVIMNNLIKSLPNKTFPKPSWSVIQNINLADPEFYISRPVDVLLGADVYSKIILNGIIKGDDTIQPIAQQTQLGWLLCGSAKTFQCNVIINNIDDIQNFWEVEDITEDGELSSEEVHCVEFFEQTTSRNEQGRYEVRLPMKQTFIKELGTSKIKAMAQFRNLERRFEKQESLATAYKTFMNEYLELNHMKPSSMTSLEYYLPHHGVERAESTTTKYRVVFNASAKTSSGQSLNDLMYTGPNLQQDLQGLLLKWRQYQYAFTADIEKMYRQILIKEEDQQLQKILWRNTQQQPIQTYQLTTVTYGMKAAPFLAMMTIKRLGRDEQKQFPEAAKVVEESFYMDDVVHGAHTITQGQKLISDLNSLLKLGGFNLRKWASNDKQLLKDLTSEQNTEDMVFTFKTENTSKTLGLCWNIKNDTFSYKYNTPQETSTLTKRMLLSEISKIYDPLGWLAPVITNLKLLFQNAWKSSNHWDEQLSNDIKIEWSKLRADIININKCEIPRWIRSNEHDVIQLHGFCDASLKAYACIIYARIKHRSDVVIIASKTRLVPIKKTITLPKLELCGAHLLSKLMSKIKKSLCQHELEVYGWTDSKVTLGWLQGEPGRWKPFVANRVQKTTTIIPKHCWEYVKTEENPADAASRGMFAAQLIHLRLWWQGPAWLQTFRAQKQNKQLFTTDEESKVIQVNMIQKTNNDNIIYNLLTRYSSFSKIVRILAWIQRTLTRKRNRPVGHLKLQELEKAKQTIVKYEQSQEFAEELQQLNKHGKLNSKNRLLSLNPYIDSSDGILRVGGRLEHAKINAEMKHPKIISNNSRLAILLIEQAHKLTFHGGPRLTLARLRQEYWIPGGNNAVKKQIRMCVTCRKHEGRLQQQQMGPLPAFRINPANPFYHTGVDYTGFLDIKANKGRGSKTYKGYVAIFVCMVTKAVHLELVTELSSSAFLAALRRMAARRGTPRHLYSDNGTNFVKANRCIQEEWEQLNNIFKDNFLTEITEMRMEWHFNAPAWPSAGGLWERAVRSLKHHLKRVVGQQKLTFEEYTTILTQLEACLNSRPLCALTENIEDLECLTPAHFLSGRAGVTVIETGEDARTRWHLTNKLFQDIWKKWKAEYLPQLTSRAKWFEPKQNIAAENIVVIHEENLPPGKWALGRVIDVHPGKDGYVRVVKLRTKNGIIKRPITKISVLPLETKIHQNQNEQTETSTLSQNRQNKQKHTTKRGTLATLALTFMYLMTVFTTGQCFRAANLDKTQGLYFDKMANMQLIRDEWKIISYYNMEPYWEGLTAYKKNYIHLEKICSIIKQVSHCDIIMLQLQTRYNEIQHNNQILLHKHTNARVQRRRRGLVNAVGNVANALFGVLDDRFLEQYQRDIILVRNNEKHLALLWKNQTSIVEAEYNLVKRIEDSMHKEHKNINQHLINLEQFSNTAMKHVNEAEKMSEFTLSAMSTSNLLTHLINIQNTLLETTTNIYNGKMNLHLIDPQQLQTQLSIISSQLDKELTLPIDNIQIYMQNIYPLLKIRYRATTDYLIFEIKIPLVSRDNYELYNILPIHSRVNNIMITLIPIEQHIAINLQKDSYLPVTQLELEHCLTKDSSNLLCLLKTPIYKMKSDNDLCIKDDKQKHKCKTEMALCQNSWTGLTKQNQYLYFCCNQCQVRTLCSDQVTVHQLTGSNIITLSEECILKTDNFTVYSHKNFESKMDINNKLEIPDIAPINKLFNITFDKPTTIENDSDASNEQLLKQIEEKIKLMKDNGDLSDRISIHDIHHYSIIYCLVGVVCIVVIIFVSRRVRCRRQPAAREPVRVRARAGNAVPRPLTPPPLPPQPAARELQPHQQCSAQVIPVNISECRKNESARVNVISESEIKARNISDKGTSPVFKRIVFSENND